MKKFLAQLPIVIILIFSFLPISTHAANLYFESSRNTVSVGDTFIVTAKIDSEKTVINSVDGNLVLKSDQNSFVVNDFSLAGSIFTLWPRTPSLSKDGGTISFVGGVAGGFNTDKVTLFNIVVEATKEGTISISPKDIALFANDGKGTRVPVKVKNLTITVNPKNEGNASNNEWANIVTLDKKAPSDFTIAIGREASLFDGKRFAFFNAIDNESGISYYEVKEGTNPVIRSGSMYVLSNQDESIAPELSVTAYDKAGNKTISNYKLPGYKLLGFSLNFYIIILALIIIYIIIKIIRRKKRQSNNNEKISRQI